MFELFLGLALLGIGLFVALVFWPFTLVAVIGYWIAGWTGVFLGLSVFLVLVLAS